MKILMVALGGERFYAEAREGIEHARRAGFTGEIDLWAENPAAAGTPPATVRKLELPEIRCPPTARAWLAKAMVASREMAPVFCLLDSYARILDLAAFEAAGKLAERFGICLPTDIRRTLSRDVTSRGSTPALIEATRHLTGHFPLWNVGVIFGSQAGGAKALLKAFADACEHHARTFGDFRDQPLFCKAVWDTGIVPLTLPDSFNVRRPFVEDPVILHTRVFGRYYGVPEVDLPLARFARFKQRVKVRAFETLRLWPLVSA